MKIKTQALDFRLPCFLKGRLQFVPLRDLQGNPIILCRLHDTNEQDIWFLETHVTELAKSGWTLAVFLSQPLPSYGESWSRPFLDFDLPVFTDLLKRFCRAFHLFHNFQFRRCETLVFDHQLHWKFRLIHDFNRREFSPVWEVAKSDLLQHGPFPRVRNSLSFNQKFPFTSQLRNRDQPGQTVTRHHELSPDSFEVFA